MPLHPSTRSWELNREQVNVIKIIGKGAFSEVAKATIWNFRENQKYITVAAKMLKGELLVCSSICSYIPIFNSRLDIFSLWILFPGAMLCGIENHYSATCFYYIYCHIEAGKIVRMVLVLKQNVFSLHMNGLFSSHIYTPLKLMILALYAESILHTCKDSYESRYRTVFF